MPGLLQRLFSALHRTRAGEELIARLSVAVRPPLDPAASIPLQNWWEPSFWEPTVALAIRDHCRPRGRSRLSATARAV